MPEIDLQLKSQEADDCSEEIYDVQYYGFRDGLFDCNEPLGDFKNSIALNIKNQGGEDVTEQFMADLKYPIDYDCEDGCD